MSVLGRVYKRCGEGGKSGYQLTFFADNTYELIHERSARRARFGELAAAAAAVRLPKEPALKTPEQWTFLGKQTPTRLHTKAMVDGSAVYGMDIRLPGMLYAALMQCPVHGGRLKSFDFDAIARMPGVRGFAVVDPAEPRRVL